MKGFRDIVIRDEPSRRPGPQQIRLRVLACGICGTDVIEGQKKGTEYRPFGHEIAGEIVELGAGVTHLRTGQRVALDSATPCGRCDSCRNAEQELCTDIQSFFHLGSFGMAEEMIAPALSAIPIEGMDPSVAALQEPLGVALDVVRVAAVRPGDNVIVMGPGRSASWPFGCAVARVRAGSSSPLIHPRPCATALHGILAPMR